MANDYVRIFDTTLRDGEQSPGATLTSVEKLEIARALARLGIDVMEAGFPAASPDDLEAVRTIAKEVGPKTSDGREPPIICGLARTTINDIDKSWEAVKYASRPRIHTFLATSEIHMTYKLKMEPKQVLQRAEEMVSYARSLCADVEFSPEDAGRSDPAFLYEILALVIRAGATTLNIPDTVGYTVPEEYGRLIAGIVQNTKGIDHCIISVHCHNDLGLATANSLAGIRAGARQAEVTINGIGERAGNTALEEVVMALQTRRPLYGLRTGIDTTQIARASKMVSQYTGISVQPNKAIVGVNAFAHEAGIHQDGMLKNAQTYEIMRPESVGVLKTNLVLGKHSGRHAFKARLEELGYSLGDQDLDQAFARFKTLADKKKHITDADIVTLLYESQGQEIDLYMLDGLQVTCGTMTMPPTATVRLRDPNGQLQSAVAMGTGPVDAAYQAINSIVKAPNTLLEMAVQSVTAGIDAQAEVTVRIQGTHAGQSLDAQKEMPLARTIGGFSADTDIVVAAVKAYLSALNKLLAVQSRQKPVTAPARTTASQETLKPARVTVNVG